MAKYNIDESVVGRKLGPAFGDFPKLAMSIRVGGIMILRRAGDYRRKVTGSVQFVREDRTTMGYFSPRRVKGIHHPLRAPCGQRIPDLVDDALLDIRPWKDTGDFLTEFREVVHGTMRMFWPPRVLSSVRTVSQNLADSCPPIHHP